MNRTNALAQALNIEPGEGRPLVLLLGHSFFMGIAIVSFFAASSALFLAAFSPEALPYVYIVSAGVSTLTGGIYSRFEKRLPISTLLTGTLVFLLVSVCAFRLSLGATDARWPAFGLMVWHIVLCALFNVEFWGLAGRLFNVRQGKRLFGLVGAGEMVASFIGGLSIPLFVRFLGVPNLLLVSAGGIVLCLVALVAINRLFGDREDSGRNERRPPRYAELLKSRYILLIFLLSLLVVIVQHFIDFTFLDQTKVRYQDEAELARFFGIFFGLGQAVTLVLLTFVSGRLISRYGIQVGMRVRPVALMVCTLAMVVTGAAYGAVGLFFWLAVTTRLFDLVLYRSMSGPSFLILYQPLGPDRKLAVQVGVESMVGPIAGGLAGGALLLFGWLESAVYLNAVTLLFLACWIAVSRQVYRSYKGALADALSRRRLEGTSLSLDGRAIVDILKARLESPHAGEVIYALDLLEKVEREDLELLLAGLLDHPAPEVRRDVLDRIQRVGAGFLLPAVQNRVEQEGAPPVKAAALKALCALGEAEAVDTVAPYLGHPDPEVKLGATVGLLQSGGIDGVLVAGRYLLSLENSPEPEERIAAARVLGEVGISSFYRPLLKLLEDGNPDVRRAALAAAGEVKSSRLWPLVLENLASHTFHTHAASAFATAGALALPALRSAFSEAVAHREMQARIAGVCGRIRGEGAISILRDRIDFPDKGVRSEILASLNLCGYRAREGEIIDVRRTIREEVQDVAWALAALVDVGGGEAVALLQRALRQEVEQVRRRCFLLLSFVYDSDTILRAEENLYHESGEQRAYALEVLHTTISRDLAIILFPLFERLEPAACLERLEYHFPQQRLSRNERLADVIGRKDRWVDPWVQACAVYSAAALRVAACIDAVVLALSHPDDLVRETAAGALFRLDRGAYEKRVGALESDVSPRVIRAVEKIEQGKEEDMLLTIEKVMVLKSVRVFSGVPEEVLADLASLMEEVEAPAGDAVYVKGDMGQMMYIVVSGRVRLHDGDRTFVLLGERDFFGELTTLDPEPQMATATAVEDTRLLGLDGDALYELMSHHSEVLRGIIHVLCRRLRGKGENERW